MLIEIFSNNWSPLLLFWYCISTTDVLQETWSSNSLLIWLSYVHELFREQMSRGARGGSRSRQTFTLFSMFAVGTFLPLLRWLSYHLLAAPEMPSFSLNEALMN